MFGRHVLFSPMSAIESDFGNMTVWDQVEDSTMSPLAASILGPDEVPDGEPCTWEALVSGGYTPYSYEWTGAFSGSGSSVSGTVSASTWLALVVTDSAWQYDSDTIDISIDEELEECPA